MGLPERSPGGESIVIAGRAFKDRDEITSFVRAIQGSLGDNQMLGPEDAFFIFHLATFHPSFAEKMTAPVVGFKYGPHENFPGSKCFFVVRADATEESISIMRCIDEVIPRTRGMKRPREDAD